MAGRGYKLAVTVWVLALAAGWSAGQTTAPATQPSTRPAATQAATTQPAAGQSATTQPGRTGPALSWPTDKLDYRTREEIRMPWEQMLASVLILLVLGGVALVVTRKVLPRIRTGPGKTMKVLETTYLAPRQALHLVQVGGRRYLLASGKDGINLLTEVPSSFDDHVQDQLSRGLTKEGAQ